MKKTNKLLISMGMAVALMASPLASAGVFSTIAGFTMEERKVDAQYTIDAAGFNPRVYEFTPKTDKSKTCVVMFGNSSDDRSTGQLFCFNKGRR